MGLSRLASLKDFVCCHSGGNLRSRVGFHPLEVLGEGEEGGGEED